MAVNGAAGRIQLQRAVKVCERLLPAALIAVVQPHAGHVFCIFGLQLTGGLEVRLRSIWIVRTLQQAAPAMPDFTWAQTSHNDNVCRIGTCVCMHY